MVAILSQPQGVNPYDAEFIFSKHKYILFSIFMILSTHRNGAGSWNVSPWKTKTVLYSQDYWGQFPGIV